MQRMAHGWDSYFQNLPSLSSDPGTLRTSESEGALSQHTDGFIGHHVFSSTAALQEAPVPNSNFNTSFCTNPSIENSSSDCVYQRYCSDVQWQADGEQLEKDYLQRCENGDFPDFATDGLPTSESFPSSFAPDLQGLKQDCEILATSCLGNYSDVSSCSDTDTSETRPSCKFMESDSFPKSKNDILSKDSSSECFFSEAGNMTFLTDGLCGNMSETNVIIPSNVKAGENIDLNKVACVQDKIESPEKTVKSHAGHEQSSTTSSIVATTESETVFNQYDHDGFQNQKQKEHMERNLKECTYPDLSLAENLIGDGIYQNPVVKEELLTSASPARFETDQHYVDENSTYGKNVTEYALGKSQVLKRVREESGSLENEITDETAFSIPDPTDYGVENLETECQEREVQKNTSQSSYPPAIKEMSSKDSSHEPSESTLMNSHGIKSSLQLPEHQCSPETLGQDTSYKSHGEMSDDHLSDASVANLSESCLQPNDYSTDISIDKESSHEDKHAACRVGSGLQSHSTSADYKSQMDQELTGEAKMTKLSQGSDCNDTNNRLAKNSAVENCQDAAVHVDSCLQPNGLSADIHPSLEMEISLLEKMAPTFSPDPDCSAPIDIHDENIERVANCPESCLQPNGSGTSIHPCQEMETSLPDRTTPNASPDPESSGPSVKSDSLSSDASEKNQQSVGTKLKSRLQSNSPNTGMHRCLAKEWATPVERTSIASPANSERNRQALVTNSNKQSISNSLEDPLHPNTSRLNINPRAEELISPGGNKNTISPPDQLQSLHEGIEPQILIEGVSENARESFEDLDSFVEDQSMPDLLYGEPLSREDSSCDSDEMNAALGETTATTPSEDSMDHLEGAALHLKSSLQMRELLQPVVILNTSESANGKGDSYRCTDCQHTTRKVDDLIEHHYCCHPMLSFTFCKACNVYLIDNEHGEKHFCTEIKESPQLSTSSIPKKKRKFQGRHKCSKCGLIFSKILHYVKHMRSHTGKTPFRCNECGSYFSQPSTLRRHKIIPGRCKLPQLPVKSPDAHAGESETPPQKVVPQKILDDGMKKCYVRLIDISRRNLCHICGKSFASAKKAKKHIYSVHKKKKVCVSSDQSTTNDSSGYTPEVKSEVRAKYKCPICPRLFKYSYNRARHLRDCVRNAIYGGKEKVGNKYVCPLCKAAFTLTSNRYRHIKVICLRECLNRLAKERAKSWQETGKQKSKETVSKPQSTENVQKPQSKDNVQKSQSKENVQKPQAKEEVQNAQSKANVQKAQWKDYEPKKQALPTLTPPKSVPRYKCNHCPAVFCHASGKYRHMKKHELLKLTGNVVKYKNSVFPFMSKTESSTKTEESIDQLETAEENKNPDLSCHFCGKCFTTASSLKRHEHNHRGERPYHCVECGKAFKKRAHLMGHRIVHQKSIQCTVCKKMLPTVGELLQHRRSHLKKGVLQCPDCPAQFQYPAHLLRHLKNHPHKNKKAHEPEEGTPIKPQQSLETVKEQNEPKQVQCSLCKEVFDDPHILRKHCLTHISGSSLNQCPFCKLNFSNRRYLLRHMVIHTGDKSFSCTNCGKQFYRTMFLRLHSQKCLPPETSHSITEESSDRMKIPHACDICPRRFYKKDRLHKHLIAHRKKSLLLCSRCGQYFGPNKIGQHKLTCNVKANLSILDESGNFMKSPSQASENNNGTPSKSKATPLLRFKCPYCTQKFRYRSLFLRHLVSHTGVQPYACMHCRLRFGSQTLCLQHEAFCDGLSTAEQSEVVKSDAAAKMDSLREATQKHSPQGESEYKCKFCTKSFIKARNLRRHILTHNEVKPYRCKSCDSCFSRYDHLKVHQGRCKAKKTRLEIRIPKISLDDVGKGWQSKFGTKPLEKQESIHCEVCLRSFPTQSKLSRHFTMFHATKAFKCTRCGASFSHEKTLKKHKKMRKCRNQKPDETNASLPLGVNQPTENVTRPLDGIRNRLLLRIQPLLNKKFKYVCGYCPRAFKNSWQLNIHTRLHTGERPYSCEYCGERFIRKDYVQRHHLKCTKKLQNSGVLCDRCGGFFPKHKLESHKNICTVRQGSPTVSPNQQPTSSSPPKGFSCAYCSSRFLLFSQLQEHFLSTHKLETINPPASAAPLQQLLSNIPKIKEEPVDESFGEEPNYHANLICKPATTQESGASNQLVCQKCNMSFTNKAGLVGHQRVHATEHPFSCKACSRGFWNKTVLRNHYRKCRPCSTKQLDVPLKAKIDFALNDSKVVFKEEPETTCTGDLQTHFSHEAELKDESPQCSEGEQSGSNIEKKTVQYQCSECDKSFTDGLMLISHLEDHGREEQERKRNTCTKCGRVCSSQANLEKHMKLHGSSQKYSCNECSKVFPTTSDLMKHSTVHNANRPFSCKLCKQRFFTRPSLCDHYSADHADDVYYCQFCSKVYAVKKSLGRHYKKWHPNEWKDLGSALLKRGSNDQQSSSHVSTTGESDEDEMNGSDSDSDSAPYFPCHVCGKTFPTSESLEDHQLCHLGEKPHECAECGKCFFHASQLQQHQRMHKSEFQCQTCGRGFVSLFALRKHKHSHGKSRPHRCSKCHLSFAGPTQLAEHMSTHREESFPCDICSRVFQSKSSRAEHRKSHSKAGDYPSPSFSREPEQSESSFVYSTEFKYRCGVCRERYRDPEELSEHGCMEAIERPYSCADCNKHFLHPSHLKKHRNTHQPSWSNCEYPCNQCNSSFSSSQHFLSHLKSHVNTAAGVKHEGEPSDGFICPVCHQCFSTPTELILHFPTHPDVTPTQEKNQLHPSGRELKEHDMCQLTTAAEYECTECGESFLGGDAFRRHRCSRQQLAGNQSKNPNRLTLSHTHQAVGEEEEVDVTGEDLYKCLDCSMQFSSKSGLLEHQNKQHMDGKQFKCERCGKTFAKMRYLKKHEGRHRLKETADTVVHVVETKFKCAQCHTKCNTAQELSLHMRLHAGEYRCDMCYKSFSQRSLLKHHQESHVGEVVYECTECDKAFAFPHLLEEHQQTHARSSH
ncbi:zinc finger protein 1035 [Odontesthes bonariensis]|uniref:zinc finger protein 1035 n=1 Tax=Odontesthes bonariensis TaxID=219752 RepID=UPI003F581F2A